MARLPVLEDAENDRIDNTPPRGGTGAPLTAAQIRDLFDKGSKDVQMEARQFWINRAFFSNEQWIAWNAWTSQLEWDEDTGYRRPLTLNRLWPATRRLEAKVLRQPLAFQVLPSSPDDGALTGARLSEDVVADTAKQHGWEDIRRQHLYTTWLGGTGGVCVEWDPTAGDDLTDDTMKDGDETDGEGGRVGTGDTVETALSIAEMVTEPGAADIEKGAWWIKAAGMPCAEAQRRWKLKVKPKADASSNLSPLQAKLLREGGASQTADLCLVLTYFERPNPKRRKGMVATVVGGEIVDGPHDWPFPFKDRLNLAVGVETMQMNRWAGATIFSTAISPQVALNRGWSSLNEHMEKCGNARIVAPETAIDLQDKITDDPADIVFYPPGPGVQPPAWMSPPAMPAWWVDFIDRCEQKIDEALGISLQAGQRSGQLRSAQALVVLSENQDATTVAFATKLAQVWSKVARMVLEIYAENVTEPREARVPQGRERPRLLTWTGEDLCGQTDAEVPAEAVQPKSEAARFQMGQTLAAMGVFGQPVDGKALARYLDQPDTNDILAELDPNEAKAQRENRDMALYDPQTGTPQFPIPAAFDNHQIHINNHNVFRLSERYERLPAELRLMVDQHVDGHTAMGAEDAGKVEGQAMVSPMLAAAPDGNAPLIPPGLFGGGGPPPPAPARGAPGVAPMEAPGAEVQQVPQASQAGGIQ